MKSSRILFLSKYIAVVVLLLSSFSALSAQTSEAVKFGFKGCVDKVYWGDELVYDFTEDGQGEHLSLPVGGIFIHLDDVVRADGGIYATSNHADYIETEYVNYELIDSKYTVQFADGRLSLVQVKNEYEADESSILSYSLKQNVKYIYRYNEKGEIQKLTVKGTTDVAGDKVSGNHVWTYKDYTYDEQGNWLTRNCYSDGEFSSQQKRRIVYHKSFLSQMRYNDALQKGDMDEIHAIAVDVEGVDEGVRARASQYWNEDLRRQIDQGRNFTWDEMENMVGDAVVSDDIKKQFLSKARTYVWNNLVLPKRDFKEVLGMQEVTFAGIVLFDEAYRMKIQERSKHLRADSLSKLYQAAQVEYNRGEYNPCAQLADQILDIEPSHVLAFDLKAASYYQMLQDRVKANTVGDADFSIFLEKFSDTKYRAMVEDQRVRYNLSRLKKYPSFDLISQIQTLPCNSVDLQRKVERKAKRAHFKLNRGNVLGFGFGGGMELGNDLYYAYGSAGFRLGYIKNVVNLYVGAKFGVVNAVSNLSKDRIYDSTCDLVFLRASVPIELRLQFARTYNRSWYFSPGLDINFNMREYIKDEDADRYLNKTDYRWVNPVTYSPRLSFGVQRKHINWHIYAVYDLSEAYDVEGISNAGISGRLDSEVFQGQTDNRWRFGSSLQICF